MKAEWVSNQVIAEAGKNCIFGFTNSSLHLKCHDRSKSYTAKSADTVGGCLVGLVLATIEKIIESIIKASDLSRGCVKIP